MLAKLFATLALVATAAFAQTIETPASLVECEPTAIVWTGGTGPFFLSVIPGGQVSAAALINFGSVATSPYTWTVNLPAGTSITFKLTDSTGTTVYSAIDTVQAGSSSACLSSTISTMSATATTGIIASIVNSASAAGSSATSPLSSGASMITSSAASTSSAMTSAMSSSSSASSVMSSSSAAMTTAPVSSASAAASSLISAASSAVPSPSATSKSGAMATAIAQVVPVAMGLIGGAAALF